jgi:ABC-2 type transport system permease protein
MNTQSSAVSTSPLDSQRLAPAVLSETRPMYWSVQRELWEHRSVYIAPLAVACVALLGFLISLVRLPYSMRALARLDLAHQRVALAMTYSHASLVLVLTGVLVGVFYCLDALHGERRDRSILFWKSLPVSDLTTVLSKASIPLVVLPLLVFLIIVAVQWVMLFLSSVVLALSGVGVAVLAPLPLLQLELGLVYGLAVLALWYAPLYAWLLLVSGWARRATFLWAVLPLAAIGVFETIAFHTSYFGSLLKDRLFGFASRAFNPKMPDGSPIDAHFIPLTQFTPGKFLSSPGLWIGLIFAAACLAAAVRLRRDREPI